MSNASRGGWLRRLRRLIPQRIRRDESGATTIEFAIVATPFLGALFMMVETGYVFFAGQVLDSATTDTARLILTGQTAGFSATSFRNDLCTRTMGLIDCNSIVIVVQTYASWSAVDVTPPVDTSGNLTQTTDVFNPGAGGSIVVVRAMYQYPVLIRSFGFDLANLANGNRLLISTVAFKSEPFKTVGAN